LGLSIPVNTGSRFEFASLFALAALFDRDSLAVLLMYEAIEAVSLSRSSALLLFRLNKLPFDNLVPDSLLAILRVSHFSPLFVILTFILKERLRILFLNSAFLLVLFYSSFFDRMFIFGKRGSSLEPDPPEKNEPDHPPSDTVSTLAEVDLDTLISELEYLRYVQVIAIAKLKETKQSEFELYQKSIEELDLVTKETMDFQTKQNEIFILLSNNVKEVSSLLHQRDGFLQTQSDGKPSEQKAVEVLRDTIG
jgi:hypothetical protein